MDDRDRSTAMAAGAACSALAALAVAVAYAVTETALHAVDSTPVLKTVGEALRASVIVALGPGFVLGAVLVGVERHVARLAWVPHVAALSGVIACIAVNPAMWWMSLVGIGLAVAASKTPWLRMPDVHAVRVAIVVTVCEVSFIAAALYHWASPGYDEMVTTVLSQSLGFAVVFAYFGSMPLRNEHVQRFIRVIIAVGCIAGLVAASGLAQVLVALYIAPKVALLVWMAAVLASLIAQMKPATSARWRWAAGSIGLLWLATIAYTTVLSVPDRFGTNKFESLVGFANGFVSIPDDLDFDGYYDVAAGGNDCAPREFSTTYDIARCISDQPAPQQQAPEPAFEPVKHAFVLVVDTLRADETGAAKQPAEGARELPGFAALRGRGVTFRRGYGAGNSTYSVLRPMLAGVNPLTFFERVPRDWTSDTHAQVASKVGLFSFKDPSRESVFLHTPLAYDLAYLGQTPDVTRASGFTTQSVVETLGLWLKQWDEKRRPGAVTMVMYSHDPHAEYRCHDGEAGGRRCYRDEVENVDRGLTQLVKLLDQYDMWKDSIVVLVSDHGEAFGEHHQYLHASSLYEEQVHVPILVAHPALRPGSVNDAPVSVLSLVSTISDATGAQAEQRSPYQSLLAVANGVAPQPAVAHDFLDFRRPAWSSRQSAFYVGDQKLVYDWGTNAARLFNIIDDPGELVDLAEARRDQAHDLRTELAETMLETRLSDDDVERISPSD